MKKRNNGAILTQLTKLTKLDAKLKNRSKVVVEQYEDSADYIKLGAVKAVRLG